MNVQDLSDLNEVIEPNLPKLSPEDYQDEVLEQFQMLSEHKALRESIKRKQQRIRHHTQ